MCICYCVYVCRALFERVYDCPQQCVSNKIIVILLFLCLPALNQLGVQTMLSLSKCSYCCSPIISVLSSPLCVISFTAFTLFCCMSGCVSCFSSSFLRVSVPLSGSALYCITLFFNHIFSFHVDCGCSWIYGFLDGGALFWDRPKMISQPAVWNISLWNSVGAQALNKCFVLVHSATEGVVHLK